MPDAALRLDRRFQQQRDVVELGALPLVIQRSRVGDELCVRLHDRVDDAQPVGAERRPGLGDFDDGVGERRRLDLGRAPRELDVDADPEPFEVRLRRAHELGGDGRAFEILRLSDTTTLPGTASTHRTLPKLCLA